MAAEDDARSGKPVATARPFPELWEVQRQVMTWNREASDLAIETFLAGQRVIATNARAIGPVFQALHPLAASLASTSESALLLLNSVKPWDADILVRSIIEGTAKFLHLAHGTPGEREQKYREYDIDLPEINRIKRHRRLQDFLDTVANPTAGEWTSYRANLLTDEELKRLETAYPKKERKALDSKWSFGAIVQEMDRTPGHPFALMKHYMHGYGMSSHILHQDSDGISIVRDRVERNSQRRDAVTLGHCARVMSDVCSMSLIRTHAAFLLTGAKPNAMQDLVTRWTQLHDTLEPVQRAFHGVENGPLTAKTA